MLRAPFVSNPRSRVINAIARVPPPQNEPILPFLPGSAERSTLQAALQRMASERLEIPVVIGGKQLRTGKTDEVRMPHKHSHVLATLHEADASHVEQAIQNALSVKEEWSRMPFTERAAIFLRAAELLATRYRPLINAATMLGQSKTVHQAEIDAAAELAADVEHDGLPAAGRLRVRGGAVQLHVHHAQPLHRAGHHGQRGAAQASLHLGL
jgi:1-pyrroline-5-carboxylate dehydrogenase